MSNFPSAGICLYGGDYSTNRLRKEVGIVFSHISVFRIIRHILIHRHARGFQIPEQIPDMLFIGVLPVGIVEITGLGCGIGVFRDLPLLPLIQRTGTGARRQ